MIHHSISPRVPLRAAETDSNAPPNRSMPDMHARRGAFMVIAVFTLIVMLGFVAFSIDTGQIALHKTIMQNAVDAAALAAAIEVVNAIENAPPEVGNPAEYAQSQARIVAADTADRNGVYVNANYDVEFGQRYYNPSTGQFEIQWGASPSNAVKVRARRDQEDTSLPDGMLPLLFAGVLGNSKTTLGAEAIGYIQSRDIAVVLDFSGSMRYDSLFRSDTVSRLGVPAIEANLEQMYSELEMPDGSLGTLDHVNPDDPASARNGEAKWLTVHGPSPDPGQAQVDVTFKYGETYAESTLPIKKIRMRFNNGSEETISGLNTLSGTFSGSGSNSGREIDRVWVTYQDGNDGVQTLQLVDSNWEVKKYFQLDSTPYPFIDGSWDQYINYVRSDSDIKRGNLRELYGGSTLAHYLLEQYPKHSQTPELARTSHFPFHAVRKGNKLLVDFLTELGFGDHVGLVSYDQFKRQESYLSENGYSVDITADPIGQHNAEIKTIMDHKQAAHYTSRTNIGGGIREARQMVKDYGRDEATPTILLMTDGNANVYENEAGMNHLQSGFTDDGFYHVPGSFDWSVFTNLEGTSVQPYSVSDDGSEQARARLYALSQAWKAVEEGYTVHTIAVGSGADTDLMKAIAFLGSGEYVEVEGDLSTENLIAEVEDAFRRIAARVPPAKLANPDEATN